MDLRVTTSIVDGVAVIALEGSADLAAAPTLSTALAGTTPAASDLALDLDGVVLLDDVALGLIIGLAARVRAGGGELIVVCTNERLLERLADTRIDRILTVRPSVAPELARRSGHAQP